MTAEVRVVIVDDHPVVRQGLRTFLAVQEGIDVVGEAGDGAEAVAMVRTLTPDVVLLDLVMPGLDGVAAIAQLTAESPDTRVLVLTSFPDDDKLLAAVQAGAAGYLLKDVAPAELASAIRAVARGEAALSSRPAARLLREYAQGGSAAGPVAGLFMRLPQGKSELRNAWSARNSMEAASFGKLTGVGLENDMFRPS